MATSVRVGKTTATGQGVQYLTFRINCVHHETHVSCRHPLNLRLNKQRPPIRKGMRTSFLPSTLMSYVDLPTASARHGHQEATP